MTEAPRQRVLRVLAAAARIADPRDALGREARARLVETSGLSREGVELALSEHLERAASDAELDAFLARARPAPRCAVVLSANVCTGAVRAIAFALATAPEVWVRPSRRDPVVAELLARALPELRIIERDELATLEPGDEVHAYGRDETLAAIAASLPEGVTLRGHGAGFGAAIVGAAADIDEAAAALARDVVPFDQRGCLSPRVAFVAGGEGRAEAFARCLSSSLEADARRVPRGPLDAATAAELVRYVATLQAIGSAFEGRDHAVGFDPRPRALVLPPAARVVHVAAAELDAARDLLAPHATRLTTIGVDAAGGRMGDSGGESELPRGWACRRAALGAMQKPPFDGPVDLRPEGATG